VSRSTIRRYILRGLVDEELTETSLAEIRRVRRLTDLGVNLAGVEVILHMRHRIAELQAETERLERLLAVRTLPPWRYELPRLSRSVCRLLTVD
jgi:DNA-binding transcriptional MerR regulator